MKLKVNCENKQIGTIEVSTIPGINHRFALKNIEYKIIKTSSDSLDVVIYKPVTIPSEPGKPGES